LSNSSGVVEESQAGLYITAYKQQHENYSTAEDFSKVLCNNNAFQQHYMQDASLTDGSLLSNQNAAKRIGDLRGTFRCCL